MEFILFIAAIILVCGVGGFLAFRRAPDGSIKRPLAAKIFLLGYIVFAGCFTFPISSVPFPFDLTKACLLISSYGIIALGFDGLFGPGRLKLVYPLTLVFTALGLLCRWLLEYGEVSNTYNFTPANVAAYMLLIPLATAAAYRCAAPLLREKER